MRQFIIPLMVKKALDFLTDWRGKENGTFIFFLAQIGGTGFPARTVSLRWAAPELGVNRGAVQPISFSFSNKPEFGNQV
jgi:hypothetical protein